MQFVVVVPSSKVAKLFDNCDLTCSLPTFITMFKGILPPRRVPSAEFIMVNPLAENGKENLPNSLPGHRHLPEAAPSPNGKVAVATKFGKAAPTQDKSKRRKGDTIPHTAPANTNSTDREFDRLLVHTCVIC